MDVDETADERPLIDNLDDPALALTEAAVAGTIAAADARSAAQSAAESSEAARESAWAARDVAARAKVATATAVAVAASTTARVAATTAAAVAGEAVSRAENVAKSATAAKEAVASTVAADADPADTRRAARTVAATVAADVVARANETREAAALVAGAVADAAYAASVAAQSAAASVEVAAIAAAASADEVSVLTAMSQVASEAVADSTARFADLGLLLRSAAALHRANAERNPPLVGQLLMAVAHAELRLHYQPIYSMESRRVVGVEALLRWQHPTHGLLPPSEFIHLVESHPALINPVGDWVLGTAVAQAAQWQRTHGADAPRIWVNVSCEQLGGQRLGDLIETLLSQAGLNSAMLGVEVTERQLIETSGDAAVDLARLRDLGVLLALDDFGTGYASLDYLRRFTFDEIKIDKSFVSGVGRDKIHTAVVSSIIELGRNLELTVVAEGVESEDQYDHLRTFGCLLCQGYLLQRPAAPEVIGPLLGSPHSVTSSNEGTVPRLRSARH